MISFGNAAPSHSGLIPLKTTAYLKWGELLWAIASKKNFINLHSAAFVTIFARSIQKNARYIFFITLPIQKSIDKYTQEVSRLLKTGKAFKQGLKYNQLKKSTQKRYIAHFIF